MFFLELLIFFFKEYSGTLGEKLSRIFARFISGAGSGKLKWCWPGWKDHFESSSFTEGEWSALRHLKCFGVVNFLGCLWCLPITPSRWIMSWQWVGSLFYEFLWYSVHLQKRAGVCVSISLTGAISRGRTFILVYFAWQFIISEDNIAKVIAAQNLESVLPKTVFPESHFPKTNFPNNYFMRKSVKFFLIDSMLKNYL